MLVLLIHLPEEWWIVPSSIIVPLSDRLHRNTWLTRLTHLEQGRNLEKDPFNRIRVFKAPKFNFTSLKKT